MWFCGEDRGADLIGKITKLGQLPETKDKLGQLYGILTILDSKATGLLTMNALFAAILAALAADHRALADAMIAPDHQWVLIFQLGCIAVSALLCLFIVRVTWQFLSKIPQSPTKSEDFEPELRRLATVIDDRTHYYRIAWWFAVLAFSSTVAWWHMCLAIVLAVVIVAWLAVHG